MNNVRIEDFYKLRFLSDVQACGKKIFFVLTKAQKKSNDYNSTIWIYDGKIKQFTSGTKDSQPRISPDGKFLAFLSQRKEKITQLFIMPLEGGEAELIVERDEISDVSWDRYSKGIYFIATEKEKRDSDIKYITTYPFYLNGKGFIFDKRPTLFHVSLNKKITKITEEPYNVISYDISKNSDDIALVMRKDNQDDFWNNLYILKNKDLEKVKVEGTFLTPKLSPDGKSIAVIYTDNKKSVFQQHYKLYLYELKDSTFKCITSDIDRNVVNTVNSDSRYGSGRQIEWIDNKIYFIITDHGSTKLYVHEETNKYLLGENESIECFAKMDEGIVYISQKINHPTELYIMKNNIRKITNFNKYFYDLPKPKKYTIKASDGIMLDLWFLAKDNEQRPGILEIHGGPKSAYGNAFMFEFYVLVSFGFNVIYSNPRGSDGDNEEFALNVKGHFGERDYKDLMETVEYGVNNLSLIKEKMGVMGASYGGFMTNWIVGHTNLFSTAITDSSLCDQISDFGTSDIGPSYDVDQISGDLWGNLEHYWNKSPLKHAKNVRTPLLIIHSDEDYRCSIVQAYELYTALKYLKKEVNLAIFPGENHEISRSGMPSHRIERLNLIVQWLKKYLL